MCFWESCFLASQTYKEYKWRLINKGESTGCGFLLGVRRYCLYEVHGVATATPSAQRNGYWHRGIGIGLVRSQHHYRRSKIWVQREIVESGNKGNWRGARARGPGWTAPSLGSSNRGVGRMRPTCLHNMMFMPIGMIRYSQSGVYVSSLYCYAVDFYLHNVHKIIRIHTNWTAENKKVTQLYVGGSIFTWALFQFATGPRNLSSCFFTVFQSTAILIQSTIPLTSIVFTRRPRQRCHFITIA